MTVTVLRTAPIVMVTVISLLFCVPGATAQEKARVQGEIVDLFCYMVRGERRAEYEACARQYTQRAVTFGVLTDGEELLLLVNQSADRAAYETAKKLAGTRARLTGTRVGKHGVASLIVESAEAP